MNEEIDESDFYHEDFTTASDWEIFIAHMEEIINQWRSNDLKDSESKVSTDDSWYIRSEKIVFIDCNFDLIWYKKISDDDTSEGTDDTLKHPLNTWHDFVFASGLDTGHKDICLAEWYGLNEYIVISPAGEIGITNNESRAKVLLSSACMLINNLSLEVPIFIQIREKWQKLYMGVYEASGIRTNFDIVHLKKCPHYCHYLPGLLEIFKCKIMSPCSNEDIAVSFQATYVLENFGNFTWKQSHIDYTDVENLFLLPFGVFSEPVNAIIFKAIWNHISEHSVVDTESYSDFTPIKATKWYCSAQFTSDPTVYDVLGDYAVMPTPESNPLDILTESAVPTISTMLHRATRVSGRSRKGSPPLSDNQLVPLLYYLFPDADQNSQFVYGEKDDKEGSRQIFKTMSEEFKSFKTCPEDSLIWRLSIILSHCIESLGGIKAFCHVWYEFVQEMRYRWEKCSMIPG
ncbi:hypothetical protein GWI33_020297 [Rhynchophorus ferrugineus]|uniref:Rab3 GTPase-activating protein catalytic subunit n=1 Tax=Rhynchophorus ferrugineus TaxID=354439 RepID=A0A834I3G2_RHYFE|nr:hypothetical protein GWI33_020297 [Rhynchophorus ferrugineus]